MEGVGKSVGGSKIGVWGSVLGCGGDEERWEGKGKCGGGVGKCVEVWGGVKRGVGKVLG